MHRVQIATVGNDAERVIATFRTKPFSKLVLLHLNKHAEAAERVAEVARTLLADVEMVEFGAPSLARTLEAVTQVCLRDGARYDEVFANVSSAEPPMCCHLVVASIASGIPAIHVEDDEAHDFPSATVPFWRFVGDVKERVLQSIADEGGRVDSLADLARAAGIDVSALSYHLRDPVHRRGLADMGLVTLSRAGSAVVVELAPIGLLALTRRRMEKTHGFEGSSLRTHPLRFARASSDPSGAAGSAAARDGTEDPAGGAYR